MFTIIIILITHFLQAVEIIKKKYHGKYHVILLFDHARAHTAKPPDSLNAAIMNRWELKNGNREANRQFAKEEPIR